MDEELIFSLTPYEVAVLTFTNPSHLDNVEGNVILTAKEAYIWAGAVAHVLVRRPGVALEELGDAVETSILKSTTVSIVKEALLGRRIGRTTYADSGLTIVRNYLLQFGLEDELDEVVDNVNDAVCSLELRGLIEDPINKKIATAILSIAMIMPVGYTSTTDGGARINSVTWEYTENLDEHNRSHYELRLKTREASHVVFNRLIPAFASVIDTMLGEHCDTQVDLKIIQEKLKLAGYYRGDIDGIFGPKTSKALRNYQRDNFLRITGYLDEKTLCAIKSI